MPPCRSATLIVVRGLVATGVVTGECSSAAVWALAACRRRLVTPHSVLLFHPMKWESEEHVGIAEAAEWARHFVQLEQDMDALLTQLLGVDSERLAAWMRPGRYVTGREFAAAGLAELIEVAPLADLTGSAPDKKPKRQSALGLSFATPTPLTPTAIASRGRVRSRGFRWRLPRAEGVGLR